MSNLEHITGAAFVGPTEAQYLKWLDEAVGEQKRLEAQRDRLREYALAIGSLIYLACGPEREDMARDIVAMARERHLQSGDLDE